MKLFSVMLTTAGPLTIEADRHDRGEKLIFYRGEAMFATFPGFLVQEVSMIDRLPPTELFFYAEGDRD